MLSSFPHNNNSETCNLKARDRKERLSWWMVSIGVSSHTAVYSHLIHRRQLTVTELRQKITENHESGGSDRARVCPIRQ